MATNAAPVVLLRAYPHGWGSGKVHQIDTEADQTLCGQVPSRCPGQRFSGYQRQITCKLCLRSIEAKTADSARRQEAADRERQWQEERWDWRARYDAYLNGDEWARRRSLVLARAKGRCEGCGERRAIQVHHRCYPRNCLPGSAEWLRAEKLFDLVAVCDECHDDVHRR